MTLILKLTADTLFYLSFANYFAGMANLPTALLWIPPVLLSLRSIISHFRNKTQSYDYAAVFMIFIKVFLPFAFFAMVFSHSYFEALALPPAIGFFVCAVALMRLNRQASEIQKKPSYMLMSLLPVVFTAIAAILFGARELVGALGNLLLGFYMNVLVPVLLGIIQIAMIIMTPFGELLSRIINIGIHTIEDVEEAFGGGLGPLEDEHQWGEVSGYELSLDPIFQLITIIILAIVVILIFRRLSKNSQVTSLWQQVSASPNFKASSSRSVKDPLRKQYRKFLHLCYRNGIIASPYYTSADYARLAKVEGADELRDIYIEVRYNNRKATQSEIAFAKGLCRNFTKSSKVK